MEDGRDILCSKDALVLSHLDQEMEAKSKLKGHEEVRLLRARRTVTLGEGKGEERTGS